MIKTIDLGNGQSLEINSSNGWLYIFQEQFGFDVLPVLMPALEAGLKAVGIALQGADGKKEIKAAELLQNFTDENVTEILTSFAGMQITTLLNIVWAMAKNANDDIKEPRVFYNQFDEFPNDIVIAEVVRQIMKTSISKKNREKIAGRVKTASLSASSVSPSPESTEG